MKTVKVENSHYKIEVDDERKFLYITLLDSNTNMRTDRNIVNNILSFSMEMPKKFNLILDFRYFDPRNKSKWFETNMDRSGKRVTEMQAGAQAFIFNEIFWQKLYYEYPELAGMYPVILRDENTGGLIGRFNTIEEGEDWLESLAEV